MANPKAPLCAADRTTLAEQGRAHFLSLVRPQLTAAHHGQFVAIDTCSGTFRIAKDELEAISKLRSVVPDARPWLVRIGADATYRFGTKVTEQA